MLINKLTTAYGDHSSLLPLFTKDVVNSIGMTAYSYDAGGKIEAKDKFIDEFGTQAIWLGGLPFYKLAADKTIYKMAKINPDVDVRLLEDKVQLKHAQNYAKTLKNPNFVKSLEQAANHSGLAKGLFIGKFAAATLLTLGSYFTLVKVKQNYTKKQVEKEFWAKKSQQHYLNKAIAKSPAFKAFNIGDVESINSQNNAAKPVNTNTPSFKGLGSMMKNFMFDPVLNLSIVDMGITGERLINSRTKTEAMEMGIKEGSFLFFMYVAGKHIQQGIEKISDKVFKKPIELHAEVLDADYLKTAIKDGKALQDAKLIKELAKNPDEFFKFIYDTNNANNTVIKAAKQSNVIETISNGNWIQKILGKAVKTDKINPLKHISQKSVVSMADNIEKLINQAPADISLIDKYLKSCRNMKVLSVGANMFVTCLVLGVIAPYSIMKYRAHQQDGSKEFHVQSEIEKQLEKNFKARMM